MNEGKAVEIKVKLQSATVQTFIWYGNSDPDDADEVFEDAKDHALYPGILSLWPLRELNSDALSLQSSSWFLQGDFSELKNPTLKDLIATRKLVNQMIEVESGEIEYQLEDFDWDGFEGDFYYQLFAEITIVLRMPLDSQIKEEIRSFLYKNLCFHADIADSRFEHSSIVGEKIQLEAKNYLLIPISAFEFEDGLVNYNPDHSSGNSEEGKLYGIINY